MLFYLLKDTFCSVPVSIFFISKSEFTSTECSLEMFCTIDKKLSIVEVMFLSEVLQELFCQSGRNRRIQRMWRILLVCGSTAVYSQ